MQNGRGYNRNGGGRAVRRDTPVKRTAASNVHKRPPKQSGHGIRFLNKIKISTGNVDYMFLGVVIVLITFGLVMLFSASSGTAYSTYGNAYYFVIRQAAWTAIGAVLMMILSKIDYHSYNAKINMIAYVVVIVLLIAVLAIGTEVKGAKRWIFGFQPSEAAKAVVVIVLAYTLSLPNNQKDLCTVRRGIFPYLKTVFDGVIMPHGLLVGGFCLLLSKQPHFSCILLIVGVAAVMFIAAGIPMRHIVICGGAVAAILVIYGVSAEYRLARLTSFLDPFKDMQGDGYQIVQSLYAIGSGGLFGVGLGKSRQKFMSLPEPQNDFIFSVLCEELGFIGALVLIILFAALLYRGIKIAKNSPDLFGSLLVVGFVAQIIIQVILNIAVVTSTVPVTGMPLPFFSYGGTAMCITMAEMGIVLNVSRQSKMLI
jgi:cell division protein FtsW